MLDSDDLNAIMRIINKGPDLTAEQISEMDSLIQTCVPIGVAHRRLKLINQKTAHDYLVITLTTLLRTVSDNVDEALTINQQVREALIIVERGIDKEKWTDSKN